MTDEQLKVVHIDCYSDVLCVWAYIAQVRIDELQSSWRDQIRFRHRYINLFGSTSHRIGDGWKDRGGYEAFGEHVKHVCEAFPHVTVSPKVWRSCRPQGSGSAHLMLKAVQLLAGDGVIADQLADQLAWEIRLAFFRDGRDVGDWRVLLAIAQSLAIDVADIEARVVDGTAMAAMARDQELRDEHKIAGSPTYLFNNGRQKLFGNVGYRILDANVRELLDQPHDQISWC